MKTEELFYNTIGIINRSLNYTYEAGKISGYTRDSIRCFMQKIEKLNDVLNLSTNETYGFKVDFIESEDK